MIHFGIICPPGNGHLNPMCALGRELQRRGHHVTLFGFPDVQPKVEGSGLDFWMIGEDEWPAGTLNKSLEGINKKSRLVFTTRRIRWMTLKLFREIPEILRVAGVEVLLVDQVVAGVGTVCDFLNLPFITVCNALLHNREAGVPPHFTSWGYNKAWWARLRNRVAYFIFDCITQPVFKSINHQRHQWSLSPYSRRDDAYSQLAQICQLAKELDFPRVNLPQYFHYTGPLQDPSGLEPISSPSFSFPFEKLTDKPLIYASLGTSQSTTQKNKWKILHKIAEACAELDVQLVISLGNPNNQEVDFSLPGSPLVVPYAPHQQLIERASLVITHAGMNTVLGALSNGVPIVAIPISYEQPGIGARLLRAGTGEVIPKSRLSVHKLRSAIKRVLTEDSYKKNASRLKEAIRRAGGVSRAADIVVQAISTGKPVLTNVNR